MSNIFSLEEFQIILNTRKDLFDDEMKEEIELTNDIILINKLKQKLETTKIVDFIRKTDYILINSKILLASDYFNHDINKCDCKDHCLFNN